MGYYIMSGPYNMTAPYVYNCDNFDNLPWYTQSCAQPPVQPQCRGYQVPNFYKRVYVPPRVAPPVGQGKPCQSAYQSIFSLK